MTPMRGSNQALQLRVGVDFFHPLYWRWLKVAGGQPARRLPGARHTRGGGRPEASGAEVAGIMWQEAASAEGWGRR